MMQTHWQAIVAVILAIGVTISMVAVSIVEFKNDGHLSADETTLLATVLGAGVGAIATYIGAKGSKDDQQQ